MLFENCDSVHGVSGHCVRSMFEPRKCIAAKEQLDRLTEVCSSSLLEPPLFFFGSFSFLDMDTGVLLLKGSSPPPELLPCLDEDMVFSSNRYWLTKQVVDLGCRLSVFVLPLLRYAFTVFTVVQGIDLYGSILNQHLFQGCSDLILPLERKSPKPPDAPPLLTKHLRLLRGNLQMTLRTITY